MGLFGRRAGGENLYKVYDIHSGKKVGEFRARTFSYADNYAFEWDLPDGEYRVVSPEGDLDVGFTFFNKRFRFFAI